VPGAEVAQLYVGLPEGAADRPAQELKGFRKVLLQPGDTGKVELELGPEAFATFDAKQEKWVVPAGDCTIKAGGSSRSLPLLEKVARPAPTLDPCVVPSWQYNFNHFREPFRSRARWIAGGPGVS